MTTMGMTARTPGRQALCPLLAAILQQMRALRASECMSKVGGTSSQACPTDAQAGSKWGWKQERMYVESGVALASEDAKHRPCQLAYDAVAACDYGQVGPWTSRTERRQIVHKVAKCTRARCHAL